MKRILSMAVRVIVSVGLIAVLLYLMRDKYHQIWAALRATDLYIFAASILAFFIAISLASYRLMLIIKAQEIPIALPEAVSLTLIGYFFNNFLPTSIGGDVVKGYYLSKRCKTKTEPFSAILVDRIIGLVTMIFMAFIALFFANRDMVDDTVRYLIYFITALCTVALIFLANKPFAKRFSIILVLLKPMEPKLRKAYDTINRYRTHYVLLLQSLAISIISQLCAFASLGILAFAIKSHISTIDILVRMPVISAMSLLPSINGLGLREGSTVVLFGPLIGKENAFAVSILWLLMLMIISIIGGIIYLTSPQFKVSLKNINTEELS